MNVRVAVAVKPQVWAHSAVHALQAPTQSTGSEHSNAQCTIIFVSQDDLEQKKFMLGPDTSHEEAPVSRLHTRFGMKPVKPLSARLIVLKAVEERDARDDGSVPVRLLEEKSLPTDDGGDDE